jgi:hypothetical protein
MNSDLVGPAACFRMVSDEHPPLPDPRSQVHLSELRIKSASPHAHNHVNCTQ